MGGVQGGRVALLKVDYVITDLGDVHAWLLGRDLGGWMSSGGCFSIIEGWTDGCVCASLAAARQLNNHPQKTPPKRRTCKYEYISAGRPEPFLAPLPPLAPRPCCARCSRRRRRASRPPSLSLPAPSPGDPPSSPVHPSSGSSSSVRSENCSRWLAPAVARRARLAARRGREEEGPAPLVAAWGRSRCLRRRLRGVHRGWFFGFG
jgi:hypothetical protein